jgi:glutaredoxin
MSKRQAFGLKKASIGIFLLAAATAVLAQTLYKSVTPDGRTLYSDTAPVDGRIEKTLEIRNPPSSPLSAAASAHIEQLRRKSAPALAGADASPGTSGVVLYSAVWCGYCKMAKAYLANKGITYQDNDIDTENGLAAFAQAGGRKGIPLLLAGGQRIQGFSSAAYDALFAGRK